MHRASFDHMRPAPSRDDLLGSVPGMHDYHRDPSMSSIGAVHYMPRQKVLILPALHVHALASSMPETVCLNFAFALLADCHMTNYTNAKVSKRLGMFVLKAVPHALSKVPAMQV